jgi:uncharacterized protein (TIGR02186 family)
MRRFPVLIAGALLATAALMVPASDRPGGTRFEATPAYALTQAERRRQERLRREAERKAKARKAAPKEKVKKEEEEKKPAAAPIEAAPASEPPKLARESVEADVSTRAVAVTSAFTGTETVVFGSIDNSRQPSAESGYYDVVVIVEGKAAPLVLRRKSNVAGLWVNTTSLPLTAVPSYYAIASTRPLEEIAEPETLNELDIGFGHVRLEIAPAAAGGLVSTELEEARRAVVRLKEDEGLFLREDTGVAFSGRSLFRSTIELPANIPVGPLTARVFLFHEGELLSRYTTRVKLERKGLELVLYDFAHDYPLLYGLLAVMSALACGLAASAVFTRTAA